MGSAKSGANGTQDTTTLALMCSQSGTRDIDGCALVRKALAQTLPASMSMSAPPTDETLSVTLKFGPIGLVIETAHKNSDGELHLNEQGITIMDRADQDNIDHYARFIAKVFENFFQ